MLEVLIDNICYVLCTLTDSLYFNGYKLVLLFSSTCCFICKRQITKEASNKNRKKVVRSFNLAFPYIDDVLALNIKGFVVLLMATIPLNLK